MVLVVKMATMLEECTTEEERSLVRFGRGGEKESMQRIFINKYVLFMVESVCRIKRFTTGLKNSLKDVRKRQLMPDQAALLRLRQKQLCSRWKS
jgi:hypothetical protein